MATWRGGAIDRLIQLDVSIFIGFSGGALLRGSQYVSNKFRALLEANQCRQSMSRRANCWDNAQAESLFSRYKAELLEDGVFEDVQQARSETFSYIEGYYNRVRRHSALGYKSPEEFERECNVNTKKKGSRGESIVSRKTWFCRRFGAHGESGSKMAE